MEPAVDPDEARSLVEPTTGARRVLVARAVDVELLPDLLPLGVGQEHASAVEAPQAELGRDVQLPASTDGASLMPHAELGGDDQDVARLRFPDPLEALHRVLVLPQVPLVEDLLLQPALEAAPLRDQCEDPLQRLPVGVSDSLPPRNGEPTLGQRGKLGEFLGVSERLLALQLEDLAESRNLHGQGLDDIAVGVGEAGLHLLIGVAPATQLGELG